MKNESLRASAVLLGLLLVLGRLQLEIDLKRCERSQQTMWLIAEVVRAGRKLRAIDSIDEGLKAPPEFSPCEWRPQAVMDSGAKGEVRPRLVTV